MSRHEKYANYDVEIDDYIIDFNRLRKTTFNQVKNAYPTLNELTRENFKETYAQGYKDVLDMAVTILTNNNIIDYDSDRLDAIMHENFYSEFNNILGKYYNKLGAYKKRQQNQANRNNNGNNTNYNNNSTGMNLLLLASAVAGAAAQSARESNEKDKIFASYEMEFRLSFENNMGYICEVLSAIFVEKFLDEDYVQKLNSETENILRKLDTFISADDEEEEEEETEDVEDDTDEEDEDYDDDEDEDDDEYDDEDDDDEDDDEEDEFELVTKKEKKVIEVPENFDELVAEALSVNSISYAIYRKIFAVGVMYMNIDPFDIKKIADIHDIDISNLIIDYFTLITRIDADIDLSEKIENVDEIIEECDAYTPEQSGRYSDYIANIKSYVISVKKFMELSAKIPEYKNEAELFGFISESRKITFDNVKAIEDTDSLAHSFITRLEDLSADYQLELSTELSDTVTSIMTMVDENKENYTTEFAVEISSCMDAVPDKTEPQTAFYTAYKQWIAEKIKAELKKRIKSMSHDDMIADRDSYYNGTNDFYNLVKNDIIKEDYETVLINTINDFENKDMFRICLGLEDITDADELQKLREKIISKNYSGSITETYIKKVDDKLREIGKAEVVKVLSAKISSLDYETVHSEWVSSTSGNSSVYTPDVYLSAEEITEMLAEAVDKYEKSYISDMCAELETTNLDGAYRIQAAVYESPYRDSNKSSFMSSIENRIAILRTEEINQICNGMENMNEEQLLKTVETLVGLSYQHQLKDENVIKINALIRKCRAYNYASFINSVNKSKFVGAEQSKPYLEFENEVIKHIDIAVGRDNNTFSQNMNGSTLGSLELALGYMETEAMLGLVSATYVFTQNRFYAPKYGFIFYRDIASVSSVKGLFKSGVDIKLSNSTVISVKVPKNECDIVASVFNAFMNLR